MLNKDKEEKIPTLMKLATVFSCLGVTSVILYSVLWTGDSPLMLAMFDYMAEWRRILIDESTWNLNAGVSHYFVYGASSAGFLLLMAFTQTTTAAFFGVSGLSLYCIGLYRERVKEKRMKENKQRALS